MPDTSTRNSLALPLAADGGQTFYTGLHSSLETIDAAIAKCNWEAATDPGVGDDSADGYVVGSWWWNTTGHRLWQCEDNSAGAAVWRQIWPALQADMSLDHGALTGLADDDHPQYIKHSLATAANDFLMASGAGAFVKKTLAEVKTALSLGAAAYVEESLYALLGGRASGQTIVGGLNAGENLSLQNNSQGDQNGVIRILNRCDFHGLVNCLRANAAIMGFNVYWSHAIGDWCRTVENQGGAVLRTYGGALEVWAAPDSVGAVDSALPGVAKLAVFSATGLDVLGSIESTNETPKLQLHGMEGSAINVSLRENAGKVELYDETGAAVYRTLYPEPVVVHIRHLPILAATGAAEALTTVWKEVIFVAPPGSSYVVTDIKVVPDALSTAFGQATHNFSLTLVNKGTDGAGTTAVSATKQFSSAASVLVPVSFGEISSANVTAGQILTVEKTITGNGLICQGCTFHLVMTRLS